MTDAPLPHWHADLQAFLVRVRRTAAVIVVAAFAGYGLAYYVWTQGQTLGALVIATLAYLLFRSMRKIAFNLTAQAYASRPGFGPALDCLDEHCLGRSEEELRLAITQQLEEKNS